MTEPKTSVTVRIREIATGKEVDHVLDVENKYLTNQNFYYSMGNGCCDCNRKLMFGESQGVEFSDEETPCGSTRYDVRVTIPGMGVVLDEITESSENDQNR